MKKYIYILFWLLSPILLQAQSSIVQAQYWFDGDYNTAVTTVTGAANLIHTDQIDASGLDDGLHILTYRFKDDRGIWGGVINKFFTKHEATSPGVHFVSHYQYWFDNDFANAKTESASGSSFDLNTDVDVENLTDGLHRITYRFKDSRGIWSSTFAKFFTKDNTTVGIREIVKYEYWLNDDYAGKTVKPVSSTTSLTVAEDVDLAALSAGVHVLNYRFQDATGRWCAPISWMFHNFSSQESNEMHEIIGVEYWFNGDYSALNKSAVSASQTLDLSTKINVSAFDEGLHYITYRFLDEAGNWSSAESRFFSNYPEAGVAEMHKITAMEYWFNGNIALASTVPIAATETFSLNEKVDVSALHEGLHFISCRFMDEAGIWSSVETRFFSTYPLADAPEMQQIVEYEYWFDGQRANAVNVNTGQTELLVIDGATDVSALDDGLHIISCRVKDKSGNWSSAESRFFSISENEVLPSENKIVGYRYWANSNIASASKVTLKTPAVVLSIDDLIDISNFPGGEHVASFQFADANGNWSAAVSQNYSKPVQPSVQISANDSSICLGTVIDFSADVFDADAIVWDFGDGNGSVDFSPTHTYVNEGNYQVTAIVTHTDSVKSVCDTIVGGVVVSPVYNVSDDKTVCSNQLPYQFGSQNLSAPGSYVETFTSVHGCDSVVTLQFAVESVIEETIDAAICEDEGYFFAGAMLSDAATYKDTLQSAGGCDSIVMLNLSVHPVYETPIAETICKGDDFVFAGESLTQSGEYRDTLQSVNFCDSVVVLTLTVNPVFETIIDSSICSGESVAFGGELLSTEAQYRDTLTAQNGCDSLVVLNLFVNDVYEVKDTARICQGDSYWFAGVERTVAGDYQHIFTSAQNCDSTVSLALIVVPMLTEELNVGICQGDSYYFDGVHRTIAGEYKDTLVSDSGCDSIVALSLSVYPVYETILSETICEGETFVFDGTTLTQSGIYRDTLQSENLCDSIVELTLTVNPVSETIIDTSICSSESVVFGAAVLTQEGQYRDTLTSHNTCDSVIVLNLIVTQSYDVKDTVLICEGDSYLFAGIERNTSGDYTHIFTTDEGCDSTVNLSLKVVPVLTENLAVGICKGEGYLFGGQERTMAGEYKDTLVSKIGCDSIVTLYLNVYPTFETAISAGICKGEIYSFGGNALMQSGEYRDTLQTLNSCDSIVVLSLTVNPVAETILDTAVCVGESVEFDGQMLTHAGIYKDTLQGHNFCDSIVVLNLSINDTFNVQKDLSVCEPDLPYRFGTQELSGAGEYVELFKTTMGCDSLVTLNLIVKDTFVVYDTVMVCENNLPFSFGAQALSVAGDYSEVFSASNACDSTVYLHLIVHKSYSITRRKTIKASEFPYVFEGRSVNKPGTYQKNLTTVHGCDSVITLYLSQTDDIAPQAKCNEIEILLPVSGNYKITDADMQHLAEGSNDNLSAFDDLQLDVSKSGFSCGDLGENEITLFVSDKAGNESSCIAIVNVVSTNDNPTLDPIDDLIVEEDSFVLVDLHGMSWGNDCLPQSLVVIADSDNPNLISSINVNYNSPDSIGSLEIELLEDKNGLATITVVVSDSLGLEAEQHFQLNVLPVNDAPDVVGSIPDMELEESDSIRIGICINDSSIFHDCENDSMKFVVSIRKVENGGQELNILFEGNVHDVPGWVTVVETADSVLLDLKPGVVDTGCYVVTITAIDKLGASSSVSFEICVAAKITGADFLARDNFDVSLYPNPSKGLVNIDFSDQLSEVEVTAMTISGAEVYRKKSRYTDHLVLDLSEQVSGVYLIRIKSEEKQMVKKIILDRK